MKLNKNTKYEACVAKTTLPKGAILSRDIKLDTWYPVSNLNQFEHTGNTFFTIPGTHLPTLQCKTPRCLHLSGGNWKFRKVTQSKEGE